MSTALTASACSHQSFILETLTLALGRADGSVSVATIVIELYSGIPSLTPPASAMVTHTVEVPLATAPSYVSIDLPDSFELASSSSAALGLRAVGPGAQWFSVEGSSSPNNAPNDGIATPLGALASLDGIAWAAADVYRGFQLKARLRPCAAASTPTQSPSKGCQAVNGSCTLPVSNAAESHAVASGAELLVNTGAVWGVAVAAVLLVGAVTAGGVLLRRRRHRHRKPLFAFKDHVEAHPLVKQQVYPWEPMYKGKETPHRCGEPLMLCVQGLWRHGVRPCTGQGRKDTVHGTARNCGHP